MGGYFDGAASVALGALLHALTTSSRVLGASRCSRSRQPPIPNGRGLGILRLTLDILVLYTIDSNSS
ncbi:hypothetical protein COCMIDRAFT_111423 [Bipolaris oryzae ATCC 44560]|uniref:Uncharacterized protein n=1 Tax=Bipolaris oryzae ATCC 44560 TaxID=930090 RepID=W6YPP5_COCMI|nr:uncharacterized protein COCMIDRAFT_111423 [Bipolaris oryzae ATCC 44560]EUC39493.1 hypothetical protein COCMIDRAFT_111423 [Bipolaris oryzae ATCC 44560]